MDRLGSVSYVSHENKMPRGSDFLLGWVSSLSCELTLGHFQVATVEICAGQHELVLLYTLLTVNHVSRFVQCGWKVIVCPPQSPIPRKMETNTPTTTYTIIQADGLYPVYTSETPIAVQIEANPVYRTMSSSKKSLRQIRHTHIKSTIGKPIYGQLVRER